MTTEVIGVAGLGTMGLGIALVYAQAGHPVRATDIDPGARGQAFARLAGLLGPRVEMGALSAADRDAILGRITVADTVEGLAPAVLAIEAIVEKLGPKQALFAVLERALGAGAVLASNTSSLSIGAIAASMERPSRLLGLHFFNPAPAMKLVELVAHRGTSAEAVALARRLTEGAGKTVIACPDSPGFIVNRCARPYYGEALALLEEGRTAAEIDAAMVAGGYRLGPFALIDLIGADINLAATEGLSAAMRGHPRYHVFGTLRAQVAKGALGRKTGYGFTLPAAAPKAAPDDAAEIVLRIEAALVNEAAWLAGDGGVAAPDVDTALRLGLNFPRGPFEMLERHGKARILAVLAGLAGAAPAHLMDRYAPARLLLMG